MRGVVRIGLVVAVAGAVTFAAHGAQAGITPVTGTLHVTKAVEGDVPPGTTFTVEVHCPLIDEGPPTDSAAVDAATGDGWEAAPEGPLADRDFTLTFTEEGGTQDVPIFFENRNCTVTETEDGGAEATTYAAGAEDNGCLVTPGPDSAEAEFGAPVECEVVVTNTFPEPEPEPAAVAVEVTPTFTG